MRIDLLHAGLNKLVINDQYLVDVSNLRDDIISTNVTLFVYLRFSLLNGTEVQAQGSLGGDIELRCQYSLSPFLYQISSDIDIIFTNNLEASLGDQDTFYTNNNLDLLAYLKEEILINIPMVPIMEE